MSDVEVIELSSENDDAEVIELSSDSEIEVDVLPSSSGNFSQICHVNTQERYPDASNHVQRVKKEEEEEEEEASDYDDDADNEATIGLAEGDSRSVASLYQMLELEPSKSDKFMVQKRKAQLIIDPLVDTALEPQRALAQVLEHAVKRMVTDETHIGLILRQPTTANDIRIPIRTVDNFSGEMVLNEIERKIQSAGKNFGLTDAQLEIEVTLARDGFVGSGRVRKSLQQTLLAVQQDTDKYSWSKSLTKVPGADKCMLKAFVLGDLYIQAASASDDVTRRTIQRRFENLQRSSRLRELNAEVQLVMRRTGIHKTRGYGFDDLRILQDAYPNYQIICFDRDGIPFFTGPPVRNEKNVMGLLLDRNEDNDGHFFHIKRLNSFLSRGFYCTVCKVKSGSKKDHYNCPHICRRCGHRSPDGILDECDGDRDIFCPDCNRHFKSDQCAEQHKKPGPRNGKSWCMRSKVCGDCNTLMSGRCKHTCEEKYCHTCQVTRTPDHICSISRIGPAKFHDETRVVFDIETCLQKRVHRKKEYFFHTPMLIVAMRSCRLCRHYVPRNIEDQAECKYCGNDDVGFRRIKTFEWFNDGENTVTTDFVQWLKLHQDTTFIAHNLKSFDGQFVLAELEKGATAPRVIQSGRKIMLLKIGKNRMVDSLNFLPMKLADFTKAFGLMELKKGYFPHKMNKPENFNIADVPVPDKEMYLPEGMTANELAKFTSWHDEQRDKDVRFHFKSDIRDYCFSDVVLLSQGVHKFSNQFFEQTRVRPFEESSTIASAAMQVFRRNFVVRGQIAITKPLSTGAVQSRIAACFLEWYSKDSGLSVQHKYRGGEYQIPGTRYLVDGFVQAQNCQQGKVIEIHGCFFHLHNCKYDQFSTMHGDSQATIATRDRLKREAIEAAGYELEVYWECDIRRMLKRNPEMHNFFQECIFETRIDLRDAFYGGRVEVFTLKMDKEDLNQILAYYDYCSLYPWVNKYMPYPVGEGRSVHPDDVPVPIRNRDQLLIRGFLRCQVQAPKDLQIPVLPYRAGGVLLFGTCRNCMEKFQTTECDHTDEERAFVGTWATAELEVAIGKGYFITKIFAALHWDKWSQHDRTLPEYDYKRYGPFSKYIDSFVKLKTEASGYPDWCITQEQKDAYVEDFFKLEGIRLTPGKIAKNPEARQVAKLLLNSLWGKMGQRTDRRNVKYIACPRDFWKMLGNNEFDILDISMCGTEMLKVEYENGAPSESKNVPPYLSVAYAALTTTYGRLRLYEAMDLLPSEDLAYVDTDSLIYRHPRGANPLEPLIGNGLGQLTCEISHGMEMLHFVAQGPKCYAYTLKSTTDGQGVESAVVKCRGFKQTNTAAQLVNYKSMLRHVEQLDKDEDIEVIPVDYHIIQNNGTHQLYNVKQLKNFDAMFRKRRLVGEYKTRPYGFSP